MQDHIPTLAMPHGCDCEARCGCDAADQGCLCTTHGAGRGAARKANSATRSLPAFVGSLVALVLASG